MNAQPASPSDSSPTDRAAGTAAGAEEQRLWLSALADGDAGAVAQGLQAWRDDEQARASWHSYHLIGDVMRSDELARDPGHDAAFLARLRRRLADEPVVMAPEPLPAAAPRRRHAWLAPAAVAAGFVAVAGVLVVTQLSQTIPMGDAGVLAQGAASSPLSLTSSASAGRPVARQPQIVVDRNLIRDAQLDRYLEAHRGAMGSAVAVPGGAMRSVDAVIQPQPGR